MSTSEPTMVTAETITDAQLWELRRHGSTPITGNGVEYATGVVLGLIPIEVPEHVIGAESRDLIREQHREDCRARCAAAWNARQGGGAVTQAADRHGEWSRCNRCDYPAQITRAPAFGGFLCADASGVRCWNGRECSLRMRRQARARP